MVSRIYFPGKQKVVIDDVDSDLTSLKWRITDPANRRKDAFPTVTRRGTRGIILLTRVIAERKLGRSLTSTEQVIHKNLNWMDYTRDNLIVTDRYGVRHIDRSHIDAKSEFKGVSWHQNSNKWIAKIIHNRAPIHLGVFSNEIDAARAYNFAAIEYFGKNARLNSTVLEV